MSYHVSEEKEFTIGEIVDFFIKHWQIIGIFVFLFASYAAYDYKTNPSFSAKSILVFQKQGSSPLQSVTANISGISLDNYWSEDKLEHHLLYLQSLTFYRRLSEFLVKTEKLHGTVEQLMGAEFLEFSETYAGTNQYNYRLDQAVERMALALWSVAAVDQIGPNSLSFTASSSDKGLAVTLANLFANFAVSQIQSQFLNEVDEVQAFFAEQLEKANTEVREYDEMLLKMQKDYVSNDISKTERAYFNLQEKLKAELSQNKISLRKNLSLLKEFDEARPAEINGDNALSSDKFMPTVQGDTLKFENRELIARIDAIEQLLGEVEGSAREIPRIEASMARLRRRIELQNEYIATLMNQKVNTDVLKISLKNKVSILEKALLSRARRNGNLNQKVAAATGVGLVASILFILVLNTLNPIVRRVKDVAHLGMVPLGKIPDFSRYDTQFNLKRIFKHVPRKAQNVFISRVLLKMNLDTPEAMAFRHLRARFLSYLDQLTNKPKVISVVSPAPGAGKSFVAANFAGALAHLGLKTLLLDCDLRNPTISRTVQAQDLPGLTDLLDSKKPNDYKKYVVTLQNGLNILPAGNYHESVTELLSGKQAEAFIKKVQEDYDYIVLDVPPLSKVAESIALSRMSQFVMMVVTLGHSKTTDVMDSLEILVNNGQAEIGYIANRVGATSSYQYDVRSRIERERRLKQEEEDDQKTA